MKRDEKRIIDEFLKKLFPSPPPDEMEASREKIYQRIVEAEPEKTAEFVWPPDPRQKWIARVDYVVMQAVQLLNGDGTRQTIMDKVNELSPGKYADGDVRRSLKQLQTAGIVSRQVYWVEGREGPFFTLTPRGGRVLAKMPTAAETANDTLEAQEENQ